MRQPILYADQLWKSQRIYPIGLVLLGVVVGGASLLVPSLRHQHAGITIGGAYVNYNLIWLAYIPVGLTLGGLYLLNKWRSRVEVGDAGVRVQTLLRSVLVAYDDIRSVRVQPLDRHFPPERKRYLRPANKALLPRPALFIRVRGEDISDLRKRLGGQIVGDDSLAVPVPDPDALSWEISSRLPERAGVNQGGQRRRKRSR